MGRLALRVTAIFLVVFVGSYLGLVVYRDYISAENAAVYNVTCFNYGLNLTDMMQDNETENVSGCTCRFASFDQVLNCFCDCELKDFPLQLCHTLDGCRLSGDKCICTYGVSFE
jgi:hypothetical protein